MNEEGYIEGLKNADGIQGYALHSELIGVAIFIAAFIVQTWISGIAYLIKGGN